jgi:Protein of unknown function (DUF3606)
MRFLEGGSRGLGCAGGPFGSENSQLWARKLPCRERKVDFARQRGRSIQMSDDVKRSGSPDSKRINVHQEHELRDWAENLGVTQDQVVEAVRAVGDSAAAVKSYLGRRNKAAHPTANG